MDITTNVIKDIEDAQEDAPTLCHSIPLVVFHQYAPTFSPSLLQRGDEWHYLSARSDTAHVAPALTETASPDPAAPAAGGSGKINSNRA